MVCQINDPALFRLFWASLFNSIYCTIYLQSTDHCMMVHTTPNSQNILCPGIDHIECCGDETHSFGTFFIQFNNNSSNLYTFILLATVFVFHLSILLKFLVLF
jgi:hypothetical protein